MVLYYSGMWHEGKRDTRRAAVASSDRRANFYFGSQWMRGSADPAAQWQEYVGPWLEDAPHTAQAEVRSSSSAVEVSMEPVAEPERGYYVTRRLKRPY